MLIITQKQLDVISQSQSDSVIVRLKRYLSRSDFPSSNINKIADLEAFVRIAVKRAKMYDVVAENDVRLFIVCMLFLGQEFDTDGRFAWAKQTLSSRKLDGPEKMEKISDYLLFETEEAM